MKWLSLSGSFGHVRGVDIRFHFSMLFSIPIAYWLFRPTDVREITAALLWLTGFVLCIFLHEAGHALVAQLVGVEVIKKLVCCSCHTLPLFSYDILTRFNSSGDLLRK